MNINVIQGDITTVHADAIVNAANTALRGGGGVDGAIHRAAGPKLVAWETWMYPDGTDVAVPVVTPAFDLPAKHIIHVPGPDIRGHQCLEWNGERVWSGPISSLWNAYARSLALAGVIGARTVTFPSLSTGVFAFPLERAVPLALDALRYTAPRAPSVDTVAIVAFDDATYSAFKAALA